MEKSKSIRKILKVSDTSECFDAPNFAIVDLDAQLIERILQLNKAVKELNAACIEDWDCTPQYRFSEEDEPAEQDLEEKEWRLECERLVVDKDSCQWKSYIKHTEIRLSTDWIDIKEIEKLAKK